MSITGERIRVARKAKKISQSELAKLVNVSSGSIAMYETGAREPYGDTLSRIADVLHVTTDYLLGRTEDHTTGSSLKQSAPLDLPPGAIPLGPLVSLPYYDEIYGDPIEMQQLPDGFAVVDTNFLSDDLDKYFWLNVKDDSMIDDLRPGSRILVHRGKDIRDGDFAVVAINKAAAIVRTVQHAGQMLVLVPKNSAYEMKTVTNEEANVVGWVEGSFIPMKRPGA
jgi:repressor LexA